MKLPLREFADVIAALKGSGDNLAASEKRRAARMTVTAKVSVFLMDGNRVLRSFSALTRDISLTGVGLLQATPMSANQQVVIALPRAHSPLFVNSLALHCRPLADGLLAVGMEFAELASKETSTLLMESGDREFARIKEAMLR